MTELSVLVGNKNTVEVRADEIIAGDILVNSDNAPARVEEVFNISDQIILHMDNGAALNVYPDQVARMVKRGE